MDQLSDLLEEPRGSDVEKRSQGMDSHQLFHNRIVEAKCQWLIAGENRGQTQGCTPKCSLPLSGRCGELNTGTLPSRTHAIRDSAESVGASCAVPHHLSHISY